MKLYIVSYTNLIISVKHLCVWGVIEKAKVILLLKRLKELSSNNWDIMEIKKLVKENIDNFNHDNKDKSLEEKM
jgi:hypothetical protein